MNVKYLPDMKEFIIDSGGRRYRASLFQHKYLLEEIVPPCNDLRFCTECKTLGAVLEILMRMEMEEQKWTSTSNG